MKKYLIDISLIKIGQRWKFIEDNSRIVEVVNIEYSPRKITTKVVQELDDSKNFSSKVGVISTWNFDSNCWELLSNQE